MQRKSRLLRAATHGRSVWDILVPLGTGGSLQPVITSIAPPTVNAGSADLQIAVTGSGFGSSTVVRWNSQNLPTTFVDGSHLTATIPASDLALVGRASLTAFRGSNGGGASNAVAFNIGPGPVAPSNGFVSLVYTLGGSSLGYGTLASLYGSNLASQPVLADAAPWPFTLGGVTMTILGLPVPLYYVSPEVINFQVPFFFGTIPPKVPLVVWQGTQSTTILVTLQLYSPAIITTNIGGSGQARTVVAVTGQLAAPVGTTSDSRPAHIGEYISIYATGLGDVTNRPPNGRAALSAPLLSSSLVNPTVTIGGVTATDIPFSGLAPTLVGVFVVNVRIPPGTPVGDAIPITLSIGGLTSNTGTIAVDAAQ
jgi:uncharacterized protein (TIGR03437 family)